MNLPCFIHFYCSYGQKHMLQLPRLECVFMFLQLCLGNGCCKYCSMCLHSPAYVCVRACVCVFMCICECMQVCVCMHASVCARARVLMEYQTHKQFTWLLILFPCSLLSLEFIISEIIEECVAKIFISDRIYETL